MKTRVPASLLIAACVCLTSPLTANADSPGRILLEHLMDKPGGWAQMCNPLDPTPFRPPVPVFSGRLIDRYFELGQKEAVLLQEKRTQAVPALVEALAAMDLTKPPPVLRGFNDPGEGGGTHAGFKLNWLNPLHLKFVRELNALETLTELLRLEAQLHALLEAAEKDPNAPLPALDEDASLMPVKPGEKRETYEIIKSPGFERDRKILTCRIFQSELLGTITLLLRNEAFAPALQKLEPLERETKTRLLTEAREALAKAERDLADATKNNAAREDMKDRKYHLLEAKENLERLQKKTPADGFDAALTPAFRTEIRSLAESFLKTIPPEKRQGAAAMPKPEPKK